MQRAKKRDARRKAQAERIRTTAERILEAFETGEVPGALAQLFLRQRGGESPAASWSWGNRLWLMLNGHLDARGFRQWEQVGRQVQKGERAVYIMAPVLAKRYVSKTDDEETDEETGETTRRKRRVVVGFRYIPVFGLSQTEGEPMIEGAAELVETLPLVEVARAWGLEVRLYAAEPGGARGRTNGLSHISLGVRNASTWAHELIHCAEARLRGGLEPGQQVDQEVVAELGGAVLLECLGLKREADRGGAWAYIRGYAGEPSTAVRVCYQLIDRVCKAVELILETAESFADVASEPAQELEAA